MVTILSEALYLINRKVHRVPANPLDPYRPDPIEGSVTAPLALCDVSSGSYDCGDMSDKICLTERIVNQSPDVRPEIEPVKACYQAGAKAAIVFSNKALSWAAKIPFYSTMMMSIVWCR